MQEYIYLGIEIGSPLMVPTEGGKVHIVAGDTFSLNKEQMKHPVIADLIKASAEGPHFEKVGAVKKESVEDIEEEESTLEDLTKKELTDLAKGDGIEVPKSWNKAKIVEAITNHLSEDKE